MPVYMLNESLVFPDPEDANDDGMLAVGGDLRPERLLLAYEAGIFPWFEPNHAPMWWSPDPRSVLFTDEVHISKSMRNVINQDLFEIKTDTCFKEVMLRCSKPREKQEGSWIGEEIIEAYCSLHELGVAHSVEVFKDGELAGGLYGIFMGKIFFGESMFAEANNASKIAFIALCKQLAKMDVPLIDCQVHNDHLESLGAREIPRSTFLATLQTQLAFTSEVGKWSADFLKGALGK